MFSLYRCSRFTLTADWSLWHSYDCGNVWPPVNNEKREGWFLEGWNIERIWLEWGQRLILVQNSVCVRGRGREGDSVCAGCDQPAYWVLRVGPWGLFYNPVITGSPLPLEDEKRRKRKRRITVHISGHNVRLHWANESWLLLGHYIS